MDLLQFFSSIAWQIMFVLFLLLLIIFRKSASKFLGEFKSIKLGKDGFEFQKKISEFEETFNNMKTDTKSKLSEIIATRRFELNALLNWEKLNKLTILLIDRFGLLGLDTVKDRVEWLKKQELINNELFNELMEAKNIIDTIDSNNSEMKPEELKLFLIRIDTLYDKFAKLVDKILIDKKKLFQIELKQQLGIIELWRKISEQIMEIIHKYNPNIYELILEQSERVIFRFESEIKDILVGKQILSQSQLDIFLKYRDLNKRLSYFDKKAIEEYKAINVKKTIKIQEKIYNQLFNVQYQ